MVPERDLSSEQTDFLNVNLQRSGNIWLQGHAGSGKSILLVHSVKNSLVSNKNLKVAVVVFTHALIDLLRTGLRELGVDSINIPIMTYFEFKDNKERYDVIFVDEVQDLPKDILARMKNRAGRIIAAGDQMQSIYPNRVSPEEIKRILSCPGYPLNDIYRLTKSIVTIVVAILGNIGNILNAKINMQKKDHDILVGNASNKISETNYVWKRSKAFAANGYPTVVLLPKHNDILDFFDLVCQFENANEWKRRYIRKGRGSLPDYESLNEHLNDQDILFEYVGNSFGSLENAGNNNKVILMTDHSAKGLDFENVFIPWLTHQFQLVGQTDILKEAVFYVALTRSKNNLVLTYHGDKYHPYLNKFINKGCVTCFDIDKELLAEDEDNPTNPEW